MCPGGLNPRNPSGFAWPDLRTARPQPTDGAAENTRKKAKNSYHLNPSFMGPGLCGPTDRRCPPDPQMALARLPSLARGRESCRASHPPKHGRPVRIHASWRTKVPGDDSGGMTR